MRLLAAAGDIAATIADIRLGTPLQAWAARHGHQLRLRSLHDCRVADLEWADLLVLQRPTTRRAHALLRRMQRSGGGVVVEIDDLLTRVDRRLDHAAVIQAGRRWVLACLDAADGVTVSTARLGRALGLPHDRWQVVPNHAWPGALPASSEAPPQGTTSLPLTVVLASSDRLAGAGPALAALRQLQAARPRALRVIGIGRAADALQAAEVAAERMPAMPRAAFLALAASLPRAVALIPLEDTEFDACKSAVKFFDFAAAGVAVLCSDVAPYLDTVRDGVTGCLLPPEPAAWGTALRRAIDDEAWRAGLAAAAREDVAARFSLEHSVCAWSAALERVPLRARATAPAGAWRHVWADLLHGLRLHNRERLAQRARRRDQGR